MYIFFSLFASFFQGVASSFFAGGEPWDREAIEVMIEGGGGICMDRECATPPGIGGNRPGIPDPRREGGINP